MIPRNAPTLSAKLFTRLPGLRRLACCAAAWLLLLATAESVAGQVPGKPRDFTATADADPAVDLSWQAPSNSGGSAITGYRIRVFDDGTWGYVLVANTGASTTTYRHSEEAAARLAVPDTVRNLRISNPLINQLVLNWDAPESDGGSEITAYHTLIEHVASGQSVGDTVAADARTWSSPEFLPVNQELRVTVYAVNADGRSRAVTRTARTGRLPGTVRNLRAVAAGPNSIRLNFDAPLDPGTSAIAGWRIDVSTDGNSWGTHFIDVDNAQIPWVHEGLQSGTTRYYRVKARNEQRGRSELWSNEVSATTSPTGTPEAPTNLLARGDGESTIRLSWTAPTTVGNSAISGYRIEVSSDNGLSWTDLESNTGNANTTYAHTSLAPGSMRHYRVSAINIQGTGPASNEASTRTPEAGAPGAPTSLSARAVGEMRIDLDWTAPGNVGNSAISGYRIEVSSNAGQSWTDLESNTGNANNRYRHTGLTPGSMRHYRVSAINIQGTGPASNVASARTPEAGAPGAPTSLSARAVGEMRIDLDWTAPGNVGNSAISGYRIEVSSNAGQSWTDLESNTGNANNRYRHTGLTPGSMRHYRVSAINIQGTGPASNVASATTRTAEAPGAPRNLRAVAGGQNRINLSWTAPVNTGGSAISGYKIEVSSDAGQNWTDLVASTGNANTTYAHTSLPAGATRHYRVSAINTQGTGPASNVASARTPNAGAPGAPRNLSAVASGGHRIDLSWTAPASTGASAISGYEIEVSSDAGTNWVPLVALNNPSTTYTDTGLAPGTTRHYRVRAANASGTGPPSNVASATTRSAGTPSVPRNLNAVAIALAGGQHQINLSWVAPASTGASAISGYRIEVSSNAGQSWADLAANTGNTTTTYSHTGLAAGTTRHYRVRAINASGAGPPSNVANATTSGTTGVPGPPTNLAATADGITAIGLSWRAPSNTGTSAITGYRIEVSSNAGTSWSNLVANTGSTATTYNHTGLSANTTRHYRVSAINAAGTGVPSNVASATTAAVTRPGPPSNLEAEAGGPTEVELDWDAPASDGGSPVTGYRIEYSEDGDDWDDLEEDTESTSTRYVHRGARPGTRYWYRVRAINAAGESEPSNRVDARTDATVPDAPTGLAARAVDEGRIDLEWTAPEFDGGGALTGYRVEVSYGDVNWQVLSENTQSAATTYTHTGLDANTEATYRVAAVNAQGHGAYSNMATARTDATVAGAPRGLNARPVGTDRIDLSWTPPLDDGGSEIEGYRILVAGPAGAFTALINHTGTAAAAFSDTGLDPGTRRRYQVQAINDAGVGPSSNIASARTDPVVADAPVNVAARAEGSNAIVVTWEPPAYTGGAALAGYRIEVHDGTAWAVLVEDHGLSTTYTHGGLDPGDERRYRVRALNEAGTSEPSNVAVAATDPVVPDPPLGLEAEADGPYRIDLAWRAPEYDGGADITGYRIHVLADGESEWKVLEENTRTSATEYAHTGLEPATENRYRVAAVNAAGASYLSAPASARTDPVVPGPPENPRAEADGPHRIDLEWDEPRYTGGVPVTGYRIEVYDGGLWTALVANTRSRATSWSHAGLDPGSEWRYRVSAINEAGTGEPSDVVTAVTDPVPPDPPAGLEAAADGPHRIRLEWIAPAYTGGAPVTGYRIEGSRDDAVWTVVAETESALPGYVHRGLEPASTWYYRVSAVNRAGAGEPSAMATATTDPVRPDPPRSLRAEAQGSSRIGLYWATPTYTGGAPVTGYQVEVSENGGASWAMLVADTRSESTLYEHTGVRPGSLRHYRVSAINRAGVSDPSPVAFAKTEATVPDAPAELRAVAIDHERVGLSWAAPPFDGGAAVTGYRIEYSKDGGVSWEYVNENTQSGKTESVHGGLRPATTYHYRVAAINEKGAGAATDPVSVRTDATVPDAPSDLVAEATMPREITLTWEAPAYDGGATVMSYRVEVSPDGDEWEVLDDTDGPGTEYVHGGLEPGDTRYYRVSATNEAGTGGPSNVATATTDDPVERAARVTTAILPRFASAAAAGIVEAIAARVQAVAGGAGDDHLRVGNLMAARTGGGLGAVLNGAGAARTFGGVATWLGAASVSQGDPGTSEVRFEGGLFSAHAGADARLPRNLLAGLAVSRSSGAYDWTDITGGRDVAGTYEARMTSITPYLAWTPAGRAAVWTAASYGQGGVEIDDEVAGTRESTATMRTGAAGVTGRLLGGESGALNVRAEGWASWVGLAEADGMDALDFQVRRVRAVLEWAHLNRFEGGHEVGLLASGGGRYELNEGVADINGVEVGGGLRYASPARRLRMQGNGRLLLATGGDYEEWGVGGTVQIDPGAGGGLSLRLNPSYGPAESGAEALWANGVAPGVPGMPEAEPGRAKFTIHTEYRFGVAAPAMPAGMPPPGMPSLKPVPYARAELFGPARGLWLGARLRWLAIEGTYDKTGPALAAKGAWQW